MKSDMNCVRCERHETAFRVQILGGWKPVCPECIEPGDIVWADLPNGQLVGDVAPEVST